jgi:hypothetical protein
MLIVLPIPTIQVLTVAPHAGKNPKWIQNDLLSERTAILQAADHVTRGFDHPKWKRTGRRL